MPPFRTTLALVFLSASLFAESKKSETPDDIPLGGRFDPRQEEGVFVTASSGGRILVSRDDGRTWEETLFVTTEGDGDHGPWGFQNLHDRDGVIVAIFGWTGGHLGGRVIASDNARDWFHVSDTEKNLADSCGGIVSGETIVLASTPWGGIVRSPDFGKTWEKYPYHEEFKGVKTHHLRGASGDYQGGRLVLIGDGPTGFFSTDQGESWQLSDTSKAPRAGYGSRIVYGNGVFAYATRDGDVGISVDGGASWETVEVGVERPAYSGLSFVDGEFWLTGASGGKRSKDGRDWSALPESIPAGTFAVSDTGTLICVNRGAGGRILRSDDQGRSWEVVFEKEYPEEERISWRFSDVLFGKVNRPTPR